MAKEGKRRRKKKEDLKENNVSLIKTHLGERKNVGKERLVISHKGT